MKTGLAAWMWILIAFFGLSAAAQTPQVPLYTNADLTKFGPSTGPQERPRDSELEEESRREEWDMVQRFLDREYARIDTERALDREDRMLERTRDSEASGFGVWSYPGIRPDFYGDYGWFRPPRHLPDPGYRVLPNSLGSRIIQGGHGRYSSMNGSDAFPGAATPNGGHPQPHRHRPR